MNVGARVTVGALLGLCGLTLFGPAEAAAQTDAAASPPAAACTGAEYRQFDFWIGRWEVSERGGHAGANTIEAALGNCVLLESWRSAGSVEGRSFSIYDRASDRWHQTWVDNSGVVLSLVGAGTASRWCSRASGRGWMGSSGSTG